MKIIRQQIATMLLKRYCKLAASVPAVLFGRQDSQSHLMVNCYVNMASSLH
jgi:hypothetical protein